MPLSSKQMEYLALAWQCFETEPKIDYDKFHTVAGLASPHSARELMRVTKNKLKAEYGSMSSGMKESNASTVEGKSTTAIPKTPKTPTSSRKRAAPASSSSATPSARKSAKKSAATTPSGSQDADGEGDDEEEHQTPVPKKGKKSAGASAAGARKDSASPVKTEAEGEEDELFT